jgi:hypothetical protein
MARKRPYTPHKTLKEAQAADRAAWQEGYRRSRLIVLLWDAAQPGITFLEKLAYAQQLGKPIRLLCLDATPVPDDLCAGYADVQTARVAEPDEGGAQILRWVAELDERRTHAPE